MDSTGYNGNVWSASPAVDGNSLKMETASSHNDMMATQQSVTYLQQPPPQPQQRQLHHHHQQDHSQQSQPQDQTHTILSYTQPPQSQPQSQPQPQQQQSHHDQLDRQMIRHLLNRYSRDEISKLMQEESTSPAMHNDSASIFTSSTYSSIKSEDATSLFDSGSSILTGSDDSSKRGSILSDMSGRTPGFLARKSQSSLRNSISEMNLESDGATERSSSGKQKGAFSCGFCKEEDIQKTCTRKNDLKRHIEDFHNTNSQWFCHHRGCQMVFDWQTAYKTHLKHAHGGARVSLDDAKVYLCPQTVFACGFENCQQVFEAPGDNEASSTFKEYVGHIVKHFDEGSNSGQWSHTTRMKNLLHQSGVVSAWTTSSWVDSIRDKLKWHPQTSHILRKRLETKHIGDLQLMIQYAIALGSDPPNIQGFRDEFITPIRGQCQMSVLGHKYQPPPVMSNSTIPERDPFQFKISRGSNPELAAYLASQRRVYVPRTPVRSGRSARGPPHNVGSRSHFQTSPMASQHSFQTTQSAPMYDTQAQRRQQIQQSQKIQSHQSQHQQAMMMPQGMGQMMTDDVRAFRTIPDETPESDMDMSDSQMPDPNFVQQQPAFSTQYPPHSIPGMSSGDVLTSPITLDQSHFGEFDVPHTY